MSFSLKNGFLVVALGLVVVGAVLWFASPIVRTKLADSTASLLEWTPEAIERDPIGYTNHVERQLKSDLTTFTSTRRALSTQQDAMAKMLREKSAVLTSGEQLAGDFAEAISAGTFPATLHGKEYTETQLRTQLALTLAQLDGLKVSVDEMEKISVNAEKEIQKLVVNTEKTESQLALLQTKREIFRSGKLSSEGLAMIAQVNSVLEGNQLIIRDNPVRTIEEILNQKPAETAASADSQRVESYIQSYTAKKGNGKGKELIQTEDVPAAPGDAAKE